MKSSTALLFNFLPFVILNINTVLGVDPPSRNGYVNMNEATTSIIIRMGSKELTANAIIRLPYTFSNESYEDYSLYRYRISHKHKNFLKYPNEIKTIVFDSELLDFDDLVTLPDLQSWSVDIFACKNNYPLLIRIHGMNGYSLYKQNLVTGKWVEHEVSSISKYSIKDKNDTLSYKYNSFEDINLIYGNILNECSRLARLFCKESELRANKMEKSSLEVRLKLDDANKYLKKDIENGVEFDEMQLFGVDDDIDDFGDELQDSEERLNFFTDIDDDDSSYFGDTEADLTEYDEDTDGLENDNPYPPATKSLGNSNEHGDTEE